MTRASRWLLVVLVVLVVFVYVSVVLVVAVVPATCYAFAGSLEASSSMHADLASRLFITRSHGVVSWSAEV